MSERASKQTTTVVTTAEPRLGSGRAWAAWVIGVLFVVWLFSLETSYSVLKTDVGASIHNLSLPQIALVASVYTWVLAVGQLFSGALLDKLGARRVLLPTIVFVAAGAFLFASAQNFGMLLLSQVVLALGACTGFVGAGYIGGSWFGMAKFGLMFGLVEVVASLSSGLGSAGFSFALSHTSWRGLLYGFGVFGIILWLVALVWLRDPQPPDISAFTLPSFAKGVLSNIGQVLRRPQVILAGLAGAIFFGIQLALGVVWIPNLVAVHGIDQGTANLSASALWIGMAVGSAFINQWSDRARSRKLPYLILGVLALLAFISLIWLPINAVAALSLSFILGSTFSIQMLSFTIAGDQVPPRLIGTASSIVNGLMFIASGFLMALPGSLIGSGKPSLANFQLPMAIYVGLLVVGIVIVSLLKESFPKQAE